jgi:hypothetical protein
VREENKYVIVCYHKKLFAIISTSAFIILRQGIPVVFLSINQIMY